jgi:hypothetical protein
MAAKKTTEHTQAKQIDAAKASQDAFAMIDTKKTVKTAREQVEAASKTLFTGHDQVTAFNLAAFDACATVFEAMTGGAKKLGEKVTDYTHKSIKASVDNGQVLMACTSVDEAFELRNKMTSAAFDSVVAQGTKMTELSLKTANEGWAPVQGHIQNAFAAAKPAST